MGKLIKIEVGTKFNRLTYIKDSESINKKRFCLFYCDCGIQAILRFDSVKSGHCKSCGCYNNEIRSQKTTERNYKHGNAKRGSLERDIYNVLNCMKARCYDERNISYKNYGNRGISICDEWLIDVSAFVKWCLNNGYQKGFQIDRINNDGNYEPGNCRFVTPTQNARNKRTNRFYFYKGQKMCLSEISVKYNIKRGTLRSRLDYYGFSIEEAIEKPIKIK